jgi:hypothetical protein
VGETLTYLPPPVQITDAVAADIKAELADVAPALAEALKLQGLTRGRYPVAWGESAAGDKVDQDLIYHVVSVLERETVIRAQEGRAGEALAAGRAILIAGRSVGDEPGIDPCYARLIALRCAVQSLERSLALGMPGPEELLATYELLRDEAAQPLLLNALRGDRAALWRTVEAGYLPPDGPSGKERLRGLVGRLGSARRGRSALAGRLRKQTECVEIAKLPLEEQSQPFARIKAAAPPANDDYVGHGVWWFTSCAEDIRAFQALLRCAIIGLALERYRHETGHWPERLDDLTPEQLKAVPPDPFDGQPLRYQRMPDGVAVYADPPDDLSHFGRTAWGRFGSGRGNKMAFRLWDVDKRRQPAAEVLPPPKAQK